MASVFFAVYKWDIHGSVDFKRTADYLLVSVIGGQGQLIVDGISYDLAKGDHFILPHDVENWTMTGENLEMIVSHP